MLSKSYWKTTGTTVQGQKESQRDERGCLEWMQKGKGIFTLGESVGKGAGSAHLPEGYLFIMYLKK